MSSTKRKHERGAVLALVGMAMVALTGMAALGVDYARHALTANEAQVVADAAAQAGALAFSSDEPIEPAARRVALDNFMAGEPVRPDEIEIELGTYDPETKQFSTGGGEPNAVRVTATKAIDNIFAGMLGDPDSTIRRSAVAALGPATSAQPTLPIALSNCNFPPDCDDESCLPTLRQQPNDQDNSGFTGYTNNASSDSLRSYLPSACGGRDASSPTLYVGDSISLNNGQVDSFLQALECTVCDLGIDEFVVPIVNHCDENYTSASPPSRGGGSGTVYGFAHVTIDSFNYANGDTGCGSSAVRGGGRGDRGGGRDGGGGGTASAPESINLSAVIRDDGGFGGAGPCTGCNFDGAGLVL